MKRHLQCAEQQVSYTNVTKYCACHVKWLSCMIDARHIWNVIYNARSNRHHPPTSPNTAPATQNYTPKSKRNLPKTVERHLYGGRFDHDPNMIRPWSDHEIAKLNPSVRRAYFSPLGNAFCIENYNISRSGYLPRFHRILRLPQKVTLQDHQMLRLPRKVTLEDHQILPLPRKMNWHFTELLLYWAGTLLSWYFTLLNCYFTELLLYWAGTLLSWYQCHQILHLPRRMTLMIDVRHTWMSQEVSKWLVNGLQPTYKWGILGL